MKLYASPLSSAAFKVFAVVHELGLPVTLVPVDMMKGEHKAPAFLAKNPNGKVPVLEDGDGFCIWESNAILCYLAAQKPDSRLMPTDARGIAQVQQWLQWQATTFGPSTSEVMMETVYVKMMGRVKDDAKYAAGLEKIRRDLGVLEEALAQREFLCGPLTIADFSIVSNLLLRTTMGVDLEAFPRVKTWVARLEEKESVRKARPAL
ncbi:glutathione S-transferase family protein [Stigmatella sp. ncwal1]|uniref:Glutathione S-transferase family protein n=1 Tax=Stigmatella ashevillensis TaxID=2995309 RepID=A0ABT5DKG2_9BACT|nr:glutathione S-transferase family protein [Stigmatella ashevillena]MDC0713615.1 glutathione S-transferase family protein [Stigmatella ashevillena]